MARNSNNDGNGAWIEVHDQSATLAQWRAEHRRWWFRRPPVVAVLLLAWLWGLVLGVIAMALWK